VSNIITIYVQDLVWIISASIIKEIIPACSLMI